MTETWKSCLNQAQDSPSWAIPDTSDCVPLPSAVNLVLLDCLTAQNTGLQTKQHYRTGPFLRHVFLREVPRKTVTQKEQALLLTTLTHLVYLALQINTENEQRASSTFLAATFFFILCYRKTRRFLLIRQVCFLFRSWSIILATESPLLCQWFFSLRFHTGVG